MTKIIVQGVRQIENIRKLQSMALTVPQLYTLPGSATPGISDPLSVSNKIPKDIYNRYEAYAGKYSKLNWC